MKIILDVREQSLIEILTGPAYKDKNLSLEVAPLEIGDAVLQTDTGKALAVFERKTISDLIASIKDGRYKEQSHRLTHTSTVNNHHIVYIIEGRLPKKDRTIVLSSMTSLWYYKGFSVQRTMNVEETAELLSNVYKKIEKESSSGKISYFSQKDKEAEKEKFPFEGLANGLTEREVKESPEHSPSHVPYCSFVKKKKSDNITIANFLDIVLCQIPGIGPATATVVSSEFSSLEDIIQCLKTEKGKVSLIKVGARKVGKVAESKIKKFLVGE